ncbi:hypothetical protein [Bordetella genomosp. 1]|uniref:hypothetical protein n=1 Tax=Bordetella genomosp. 1 TaxID=1395607 RepID=UPI0015953D4E|nr:hypothetical protein [Bordetella genomosp. 1]
MKNAISALRGAPMPGGRSMPQFRAARIRRVVFHWQHRDGETGVAAAQPPAPPRKP